MVVRPYLLAACAVLPLLAPEVWSGFRLGTSDAVLSVIAPTEQPLSVHSPAGMWAMGLALAWFGLAYSQRRVGLWEAALVLLGGAAALVRMGNAWLYALAILAPLACQVRRAHLRSLVQSAAMLLSVAAALVMLALTRPPALPVVARQAAQTAAPDGAVLADWRWAPDLQRQLEAGHQVLASGGLASESADFWLDYVRIAQGHERWAEALQRRHVNLVVLDASDEQRRAAVLVRASNQWQILYDADGALVAQRTSR